jgi:hypothetical protein
VQLEAGLKTKTPPLMNANFTESMPTYKAVACVKITDKKQLFIRVYSSPFAVNNKKMLERISVQSLKAAAFCFFPQE